MCCPSRSLGQVYLVIYKGRSNLEWLHMFLVIYNARREFALAHILGKVLDIGRYWVIVRAAMVC